MTIAEIERRLADCRTLERCDRITRDIEARRQEIRARLLQIEPQPGGTLERSRAIAQGFDAVQALDREVESLKAERAHLDKVERRVYSTREDILNEAARASIPKAKKALPAAMRQVRDALENLDAAVAGLGAQVATLGEYHGVTPITAPIGDEARAQHAAAFPIDDDTLAALHELRDQLWTTRTLAVLIPPTLESHPKSWRLHYTRGAYGSVTSRRPAVWPDPAQAPLPEVELVEKPKRRSGWFGN